MLFSMLPMIFDPQNVTYDFLDDPQWDLCFLDVFHTVFPNVTNIIFDLRYGEILYIYIYRVKYPLLIFIDCEASAVRTHQALKGTMMVYSFVKFLILP